MQRNKDLMYSTPILLLFDSGNTQFISTIDNFEWLQSHISLQNKFTLNKPNKQGNIVEYLDQKTICTIGEYP
jgi:hypothetical protein